MVIDDLDIERVTRIEAEDQPPGAIDGDRPIPGSIPAQLMQTDAAQPSEIIQCLRRVQLAQAQQCALGIEAGPS